MRACAHTRRQPREMQLASRQRSHCSRWSHTGQVACCQRRHSKRWSPQTRQHAPSEGTRKDAMTAACSRCQQMTVATGCMLTGLNTLACCMPARRIRRHTVTWPPTHNHPVLPIQTPSRPARPGTADTGTRLARQTPLRLQWGDFVTLAQLAQPGTADIGTRLARPLPHCTGSHGSTPTGIGAEEGSAATPSSWAGAELMGTGAGAASAAAAGPRDGAGARSEAGTAEGAGSAGVAA